MRRSQPLCIGPGYLHLGAEVLGWVRRGVLEDLLQLIHVPKSQGKESWRGFGLGIAEKPREKLFTRTVNRLPPQ